MRTRRVAAKAAAREALAATGLIVSTDAGRSSGRVLTSHGTTLLAGKFLVAFDEESAALGAARECRSVAFVAEVSQAGSGWVLSASRKNLFPADERDRYATRLQRICGPLGGRYERFVRS